MPFKRPTANETLVAIGDTSALGPAEAEAYAVNADAYTVLPKRPPAGNWLAQQEEKGQSYKSYARRSFKCSPHGHCDTLYIVPIGVFHPIRSPPLDDLVSFARAHFGCKVQVHKAVKIKEVMANSCVGDEGQLQLDAGSIREHLCRGMKPPRDSFCLLAITMQDLYVTKNGEKWNFVFGQASAMDGVGVFSFARYDPSGLFLPLAGWSDGEDMMEEMSERDKAQQLRRCCRVLAHEGSHVVGLKHCIHFSCLMNGSNHLQESDECPLHLCPVCLRKLAEGCGFDPLERYKALAEWYLAHDGFEGQAEWIQCRIQAINEAIQQAGGELCGSCAEPPPSVVPGPRRGGRRVSADEGKAGRGPKAPAATRCTSPHVHIIQGGVSTGAAAGPREALAGCRDGAAGATPGTTGGCPLFRCQGKRGCLCAKRH